MKRQLICVCVCQGHLARYLAYHCGLNVVTVDAVGCHLMAAAKFDRSSIIILDKKVLLKKIGELTSKP